MSALRVTAQGEAYGVQNLVGLRSAFICPLDTALKMLQQVQARKSIVESIPSNT